MPTRPRLQARHPPQIRAARALLFEGNSASLADQVRVVLCEATRTQIVRALGAGPLTVTDLVGTVGRGRTAVSQHLRILRANSIVLPNRRGRLVFYSLTADVVARSIVQMLQVVAAAT